MAFLALGLLCLSISLPLRFNRSLWNCTNSNIRYFYTVFLAYFTENRYSFEPLNMDFNMHNELYSSDVIFSILLAPLTTMLIYIWKTKGKILSQIPFTISLTLLFYIIFELRKNAALIIIFGFAFLFFLFKKYRKQSFLMLIGCVGLILCTSLFNTYVLQTTKSP